MTTWDSAKRKTNLAKHRVDLALAEEFDFQHALVIEDRDIAHEQRFRAIGFIGSRLYFLVFTFGPHDEPRAISLRPATPKEKRRYAEEL